MAGSSPAMTAAGESIKNKLRTRLTASVQPLNWLSPSRHRWNLLVTTFIFQGNPDRFDIDGYLARRSERINWLMTSSYKEIRPGDQVFIWRARGSKGVYKSAGIVAECFVLSPAIEMPDDPSAARFWVEEPDNFDSLSCMAKDSPRCRKRYTSGSRANNKPPIDQ